MQWRAQRRVRARGDSDRVVLGRAVHNWRRRRFASEQGQPSLDDTRLFALGTYRHAARGSGRTTTTRANSRACTRDGVRADEEANENMDVRELAVRWPDSASLQYPQLSAE